MGSPAPDESALDIRHAPTLAAQKAELMEEFLRATRLASSLDIEGDNEDAQAEFVRLITLRENLVTEIDEIDRKLNRLEPEGATLSPKERERVFRCLEQARLSASESSSLSGNLEASLAMVCSRIQKEAARVGNPRQAKNTYGGEKKGSESPRFLDTRL